MKKKKSIKIEIEFGGEFIPIIQTLKGKLGKAGYKVKDIRFM